MGARSCGIIAPAFGYTSVRPLVAGGAPSKPPTTPGGSDGSTTSCVAGPALPPVPPEPPPPEPAEPPPPWPLRPEALQPKVSTAAVAKTRSSRMACGCFGDENQGHRRVPVLGCAR